MLVVFAIFSVSSCDSPQFEKFSHSGAAKGTQLAGSLDSIADSEVRRDERGNQGDFLWQTGQIIGISTDLPAVELITGSLVSHVGIVVIDDNQVYVYNSFPGGNPDAAGNAQGGLTRHSLGEFLGFSAKYILNGKLVPMMAVADFVVGLSDEEKDRLKSTLKSFALPTPKFSYNQNYVHTDEQATLDISKPHGCSESIRLMFREAGIDGPGKRQVGAYESFLDQPYFRVESESWDQMLKVVPGVVPEYGGITPVDVMSSPGQRIVAATIPVGESFTEAELVFYHNWYDRLVGKHPLRSNHRAKRRNSDPGIPPMPTPISFTCIQKASSAPNTVSASCEADISVFPEFHWLVDGHSEYCKNLNRCDWDNVPAGQYEVKILATDADGHSFESPKTVVRLTDQSSANLITPPSDVTCSPANPVAAGSTVTCTGRIAGYSEFYWDADGVEYCRGSAHCKWENVPAGSYQVQIKARNGAEPWVNSRSTSVLVQ
jgi:hypothetical protein